MRILVCGSREYTDGLRIRDVLGCYWSQNPVIVHGDARGADRIAAEVAEGLGFVTEAHPADWDRHGKRAGYVRNQEMLDTGVDRVIAFWDGESKGTKMMIDLAKKAGVPVSIY